ncbi:MAG TPA: hypothetical protein VLU47_00240 [Blastocatellia bacterium]|nr:hypothetical protein [Blastocatellia bacterium]
MTSRRSCFRFCISSRARRRGLSALASLSILLGVVVTVLGCGWDFGSDHSVRFNPYRTEKEFGRLPPLPKYVNADSNRLFSWDRDVEEGERWFEGDENKARLIVDLWNEATESETAGRLGDLRRRLREYLEGTEAQRYSNWGAGENV